MTMTSYFKSASLIVLVLVTAFPLYGTPIVAIDHNAEGTPDFKFAHVPSPLNNDAAAKAKFTVVDGVSGFAEGRTHQALNDGDLPGNNDSPNENFFFAQGTDGGRLQVDLGSVIEIAQVITYSWHTDSRAPQVYKLYASDGTTSAFNPLPKRNIDPTACGWNLIADVDTRTLYKKAGGQYGVSVSDLTGSLGVVSVFTL